MNRHFLPGFTLTHVLPEQLRFAFMGASAISRVFVLFLRVVFDAMRAPLTAKGHGILISKPFAGDGIKPMGVNAAGEFIR